MEENQSLAQKMIAFAQNPDSVAAIVGILKRAIGDQNRLVGDNEYQTIVNAVRLDTQTDLMIKVLNTIDFIKQGGLHQEAAEGKKS